MSAANYAEGLKRVLVHEGGYTNHPADPGGPTNWGITIWDAQKYWKRDADADDVRSMPRSVAERIYKSKYWDAMRCDDLPSGVDYAVMDFGVNSGTARSIKFLEAIAGLTQDGKPDDTLIQTIAGMDAKNVIGRLCDRRLAFLKGLKTWPTFGNGWGRRVSECKAAALAMADRGIPAPTPTPDISVGQAKPPPDVKPLAKSKTMWGGALQGITATIGAVVAFVQGLPPWLIATLAGCTVVGLFLVWKGRIDVQAIIKNLEGDEA